VGASAAGRRWGGDRHKSGKPPAACAAVAWGLIETVEAPNWSRSGAVARRALRAMGREPWGRARELAGSGPVPSSPLYEKSSRWLALRSHRGCPWDAFPQFVNFAPARGRVKGAMQGFLCPTDSYRLKVNNNKRKTGSPEATRLACCDSNLVRMSQRNDD
jgi:hypothetical protein